MTQQLHQPSSSSTSSASAITTTGTTHSSTSSTTTFNSAALTKPSSLTIDEMRTLHRQALTEAESKKTELRLVLASRYRELVGSSDEVITMERDAKVLHDLVLNLPDLVNDLIHCVNVTGITKEEKENVMEGRQEEMKTNDDQNQQQKLKQQKTKQIVMINQDRIQLSLLPRIIHSHLDQQNVHGATTALLDAFTIIGKYTNQYQLVNQFLHQKSNNSTSDSTTTGHQYTLSSLPLVDQKLLYTQMKMIYLHLQTIPLYTIQLSKRILIHQQHNHNFSNSSSSAHETAKALSALHRLNVSLFQYNDSKRSNKLLDLYFESKAMLIRKLLDRLSSNSNAKSNNGDDSGEIFSNNKDNEEDHQDDETDVAEQIISNIILILQHDIILNPFQIFMLRKYALNNSNTTIIDDDKSLVENVMNTLPTFDREQVKMKASNFLAAHLPLIRSKVKTVLVGIAGTTASRLGSIRQSLYDKTDGSACITSLSTDGVCTWDKAVQNMVDLRIIARALDGLSSTSNVTTDDHTDTSLLSSSTEGRASGSGTTTTTTAYISSSSQRKFSLWGTLFSNTFSSLVHSILSTSFHSVHRQVVATLRASLANAPSFTKILPHEAYRNTLRIASELDAALKKVSDDAHELLVHAEEREESERRLRQSLYVQTCEIMGRLLNELRRMLVPVKIDGNNGVEAKEDEDATKQLIIGRLCFLLKFRLTSLPKLLDPNSSPAVLSSRSGGKVGMITVAELQSAFEIADVDDDGLINFEEAMEAMDGAFSGTLFHGAEMVRETMLLTSGPDEKVSSNVGARSAPRSLTLSELALLSARGLRHDSSGTGSSLGIIQRTLDDIVESCFRRWSAAALSPYSKSFMASLSQFVAVASTSSEDEWKRLHKQTAFSEGDLLQEQISDTLQEGVSSSTSIQIGSVSSFIVSYFISVAALLNKSICPSDSLPPFPNDDYAMAMGYNTRDKELSMVDTLRSCLLRESLISITESISSYILEGNRMVHLDNNGDNMIKKIGPSALAQLLLDIKFTSSCFFERNKYGFARDGTGRSEIPTCVTSSKEILIESESALSSLMNESDVHYCLRIYETRITTVYNSCSMFLSSLLGEDHLSLIANKEKFDGGLEQSDNVLSLILNPLPSSRRFALLPIQAEQSMKELQLLRNLGKERGDKVESERMSGASVAANAVSSGIGYFSSLLKKK